MEPAEIDSNSFVIRIPFADVYDPKDAAQILGIHPRTFKKYYGPMVISHDALLKILAEYQLKAQRRRARAKLIAILGGADENLSD